MYRLAVFLKYRENKNARNSEINSCHKTARPTAHPKIFKNSVQIVNQEPNVQSTHKPTENNIERTSWHMQHTPHTRNTIVLRTAGLFASVVLSPPNENACHFMSFNSSIMIKSIAHHLTSIARAFVCVPTGWPADWLSLCLCFVSPLGVMYCFVWFRLQ